MRSDVFADELIIEHTARRTARPRPIGLRRGSLRYDRLAEPKLASASEGWWSQTGSNRRPHACKARALPAELWPRNQKTNALACRAEARGNQPASARWAPARQPCARLRERRLVGLGRLELPTSRLSSARSNQLSYKPEHGPTDRPRCATTHEVSTRHEVPNEAQAARARPRRKRNEDGGVPPVGLDEPLLFPRDPIEDA